MATNVILPALGMAQDTGKIVEWLKTEGQQVSAGEPIVVIETDKSAVDLEAPASGTLARVSARAGDEVPVAQVIAVILSPEEAASGANAVSGASHTGQPEHAPTSAATPALTAHPARAAQEPPSLASWVESGERRRSSPKARRMAAELGVDIAALHGSGPGGVVLAADVLADGPAELVASAALPSSSLAPLAIADETPMSTIWRLMAERTTQSWTTVPHFFLAREVVAERLVAWRERAAQQSTNQITFSDLLVKLVAVALQRHARLNDSWQNGRITHNPEVNIGLAVATHDGLVVPVIHQADTLTVSEIAQRRADLVKHAQAGRLRPDDLRNGSFTISNLGMYGIDAFTAIINAPQAAILAVGRIVDRVVPINQQPVVRPMMTLTLSCDHRVVDGARGAEFLATLAALIEEPLSLLE
jgi:pyruvate dehydrogenase E2 component (dihydrolipoamide acetyltransferase)